MAGYVRKRAQPVPPLPEESSRAKPKSLRSSAAAALVQDVSGVKHKHLRRKTPVPVEEDPPLPPPQTSVKFKQLRKGTTAVPSVEVATPVEDEGSSKLMKLKRLRKGMTTAPITYEDETVKKLKRLRKDDAVTVTGGERAVDAHSKKPKSAVAEDMEISKSVEDDAAAKLSQLREGNAGVSAAESALEDNTVVRLKASSDESATTLEEPPMEISKDDMEVQIKLADEDSSIPPEHDLVVKFKHIRKDTGAIEDEVPLRVVYSLEDCKEEAAKYHTKREFQHKARDVYDAAKRNGWMDEICAHMKPPEKFLSWGHWNLENCRLEALKYSTRIEFYKSCGSAYNSASRHNWLDEICAHMKPSNKLVKKGYWNLENCRLEALKYTRRKEFYKKCGSAYNSASRHGWLDEICAHMHTDRKPSNVSTLIQASEGGEYLEETAELPPSEGQAADEKANEEKAAEDLGEERDEDGEGRVQILLEESPPVDEQTAPAVDQESSQLELVLLKDPTPAKLKSKATGKSGGAEKVKSKGKK